MSAKDTNTEKDAQAKALDDKLAADAKAAADETRKNEVSQVDLEAALKSAEEAVQTSEASLLKATAETDLEAIMSGAATVSTARTVLLAARQAANESKIVEIERTMDKAIRALIGAVKFEEMTGEKITRLAWGINDKGVSQVLINAKPKGAKKATAGKASGRKGKTAGLTVSRTMPDGVESLTVKEAVQTYYSEDTHGNMGLYEKNAWGMLFPKVNKTLDPPFSEPTEEATS